MDFPLVDFPCVLCLRNVVKHQERYHIEGKGKFDVKEELQKLPFSVKISTRFICKHCLCTLKKRKALTRQIQYIDGEFERKYNLNNNKDTTSVNKRQGTDGDEHAITPKKQRSESFEPNKVDVPSDACTSTVFITSSPVAKTPAVLGVQWPVSPVQAKQDVSVTVKVKWPSKDAERKLPTDLESLGKMLVRGTYRQIANAAWKNPSINKHLRELVVKGIEKEATKVCSKKKPSCLRTTDKESLLSFTMEKVSIEIKERAPLLHSVLSAASINHRSKAAKERSHFGAIAMAAAVCLKNRCKHMIALQLLVTMFIYHSNWMVGSKIIPLSILFVYFMYFLRIDPWILLFQASILLMQYIVE